MAQSTSSSPRPRHSLKKLTTLVIVLVAFGTTARLARADVFDEARGLFKEAEADYRNGAYRQAAEKYLRVHRLTRMPLVFFNVAQARRLQFKTDSDYRLLVEARDYYNRFVNEAAPGPDDQKRVESGLAELENAALEEAKKRFAAAEQAIRLGKFLDAIAGYEAVYALTNRTAVLFNLGQAHRKQYPIDGKLEHLSQAEAQLVAYRSTGSAEVNLGVVNGILEEVRALKQEHNRRREAEARTKEPAPMRSAREFYQKGQAPATLTALDQAERSPGNERVVLVEIFRLRALAYLLNGDSEGATESFARYLALEPADDGTGLPPEAMASFGEAKKQWKGKKPLAIEHLPLGKVAPSKRVALAAQVASDPLKMVRHLELRWHRRDNVQKTWELVPIKADGEAKLPPQALGIGGRDESVEYVIVARDTWGGTLLTLGSDSAPLTFVVSRSAIPKKIPLYKKWWFWATAGTVAAGVATAVVLTRRDSIPTVAVNVSTLQVSP